MHKIWRYSLLKIKYRLSHPNEGWSKNGKSNHWHFPKCYSHVPSFCLQLFHGAHAPGAGGAKRLSINGFKCTECDGNLIWNHMVFPKCSKWPRLKGTRFKKNNPATIKNIWINKRQQWLPFPYWIHGRVASALWLIFGSDNSSLFISFQLWWAILRAAVGGRKKKKRISSLPPSNRQTAIIKNPSGLGGVWSTHEIIENRREKKKKNQNSLSWI